MRARMIGNGGTSSGDASFRAGVGAIITNATCDMVLLFRRSDHTDTWQCPQGGINRGEQAEEAVFREIFEETGILPDELRVVAFCPLWVGYELPKSSSTSDFGRGQVHRWYIFRLLTSYDDFRVTETSEFVDASWYRIEEWAKTGPSFKKEVISFLVDWFLSVTISSDNNP